MIPIDADMLSKDGPWGFCQAVGDVSDQTAYLPILPDTSVNYIIVREGKHRGQSRL